MESLTNKPESLAPVLERASFSDRFFSLMVDNIIMYAVLKVLQILTSKLWPALYDNLAIIMSIMLAAVLGYFAVYAWKNGGQTVGKRWNQVKVVDLAGSQLTLGRFLFRELVARGPAVFGMFGIITMLLNPWYLTYLLALTGEKRSLHDIIAGTQVIKVNKANA